MIHPMVAESICNMTNLQLLNISRNGISAIPWCIWEDTLPLGYIDMSFNNINGTLPRILAPKAGYVNIENNQFEGSLPLSISSLRARN
jgi:hypothetical protein